MARNNEDLQNEIGDFLSNEVPEGFEEDIEPEEDFFETDDLGDPEENELDDPEEETDDDDPAEGADDPENPEDPEEPEEPEESTGNDDVDPEPSELDDLKAQNAALLERLEALQSGNDPGEEEEPTTPASQSQQVQVGNVDFIGDGDLDEILSSKDAFNTFMNEALAKNTAQVIEQVYRNIPNMVTHQVRSQRELQTYVDEFYKKNEDLLTVRKTVGAVANEVTAEMPGATLDQIFAETEVRVRKLMGLKKTATAEETKSSRTQAQKTGLPTRGSKRGSRGAKTPRLTGQAKHINDVL